MNYTNLDITRKEEMELKMKDLFPLRYEGRNPAYTVLKHNYIYNEYLNIINEVEDKFPELARFLPQRYYYQIIAHRFSLTPNYVCSLINKIRRHRDNNRRREEKQNQTSDETRGIIRRKQ